LEIEHSGSLNDNVPRPPRHARCCYDVIGSNNIPQYIETIVNVENKNVVSTEIIDTAQHAPLTM
jgi:primary-amine oxidase